MKGVSVIVARMTKNKGLFFITYIELKEHIRGDTYLNAVKKKTHLYLGHSVT